MTQSKSGTILSQNICEKLFPEDRADRFFEALYGDVEEGAYDIHMKFKEQTRDKLKFEFQLKQRPGKCLACNLTYGLPNVFSRHPIIDINGLVQKIENLLGEQVKCTEWRLEATREMSKELHVVRLQITLNTSG
jgi:hypothetical protein